MDEVHRQPPQVVPTPREPDAPARASSRAKRVSGRRAPGKAAAPATAPVAPAPLPSIEDSLCSRCAALCCRYVALPIDNPEDARDYDNIRWYLMHENIHVFVDDGQWYIAFATRCKHLQDDNLCGVYLTRPRVCRNYDTTNCEYHGAEYRYEHLFTSADQLQRHAEKELGRSILFKPRPKKPKLKRGPNGRRAVELPLA